MTASFCWDEHFPLKSWDLPLVRTAVYSGGAASTIRGGPSGTNWASLTARAVMCAANCVWIFNHASAGSCRPSEGSSLQFISFDEFWGKSYKNRVIYKLTLTAPDGFANNAILLREASGKTERAIVFIWGCPPNHLSHVGWRKPRGMCMRWTKWE